MKYHPILSPQQYLSIVIFIVSTSLLTVGCKKDADNPVQSTTTKSVWELDNNFFRSDKIVLNSSVLNDTFTIAGFNTISLFNASANTPSRKVIANEFGTLASKPVSSGNYWMYGGAKGTQFVLYSPVYMRGSTSSALTFFWGLRLNEIDSSYSAKAVPMSNSYTTPIGAFNSKHQFFSAISDTDGASFCIIDLNAVYTPAFNTLLSSLSPTLKKITLTGNDKYSYWTPFISSYKENFFVCTDQGNFIVYPNGTYRSLPQIIGRMYDMFPYRDTLYTLTSNGTLFRSGDNGESWSSFAGNFPSEYAKHFYIGDSLYFYIYSQLLSVNFTTGTVTEFDNSGLELNEITSVNRFGSTVWVTTLSGLFRKPAADFLTPRAKTSTSKKGSRILHDKLILYK